MREQEKDWFRDAEFWDDFQSVLFPKERLEIAPKQVEQIIELLDLEEGMKILDLCCGIGRHSIEFARRGFEVTGVDLTPQYLSNARKKAQDEGLDIEFIEGDMREFERSESFDVVLNIYTSFGYFEDNKDNIRVIENAYNSLKPDGKFLVDVLGKEIISKIFKEREFNELEEGYLIEEREIKKDGSYMKSRWILVKDGETKEHEFSYWMYSEDEMKDMLDDVGFGDIKLYGDYRGAQFDEDAERLIAVGIK